MNGQPRQGYVLTIAHAFSQRLFSRYGLSGQDLQDLVPVNCLHDPNA
jgi:hypothetical protein